MMRRMIRIAPHYWAALALSASPLLLSSREAYQPLTLNAGLHGSIMCVRVENDTSFISMQLFVRRCDMFSIL